MQGLPLQYTRNSCETLFFSSERIIRYPLFFFPLPRFRRPVTRNKRAKLANKFRTGRKESPPQTQEARTKEETLDVFISTVEYERSRCWPLLMRRRIISTLAEGVLSVEASSFFFFCCLFVFVACYWCSFRRYCRGKRRGYERGCLNVAKWTRKFCFGSGRIVWGAFHWSKLAFHLKQSGSVVDIPVSMNRQIILWCLHVNKCASLFILICSNEDSYVNVHREKSIYLSWSISLK